MLTGLGHATPQGTAGLDYLRDCLLTLDDDELVQYLQECTPTEREQVAKALARPQLLDHQRPPLGHWTKWLLLAGRGAGKSLACSVWFDQHMTGPPCDERIPGGHQALIVAPTQGDATLSCVEGPAGLKTVNPDVQSYSTKGGTHAFWPGGAKALLLGAHSKEDVERFRAAGNRCAVWCEELAAWRFAEKVMEIMDFGVRTTTGATPRFVASTTPKARPLVKEWIHDPGVVKTRASMLDNPYLNEERRQQLLEKYEGTRLGRQELHGEYLEDAEGALWTSENLAQHHLDRPPAVDALTVGVDPPGSTAECGIVVVVGWLAQDGVHIGVQRDATTSAPHGGANLPEMWAPKVEAAWRSSGAPLVVFEKNQGWEMGVSILRQQNPGMPVKSVVASKGKYTRAEPFSLMAEQGRFHLLGDPKPELEEQMTGWTPGEDSPDRLDAMVWGATWVLERLSRGPAKLSRVAAGPPIVPAKIGATVQKPGMWRGAEGWR